MSSSTETDAPVPAEILLLVGPTLIGALLSYLLFGISIMQLCTYYLYHLSYPNDFIAIKASVYVIFVLDIFQSVVVAANAWHLLCSGWGRETALIFPGWTFIALPIVSGIVAAWVQIFYAWRIRLLGRWKVIPCLICLTALAQCGGAFGISIGFVPLKNVALLHETTMYARTIVWLGGAAFTDAMISFSMLYLLFRAKQTHFSRTQKVVNTLIRLTIETGLVTATCATTELILFLASSSTELHIIFAFMLCKVYSNALMTSLNSRKTLGKEPDGTNGTSGTMQWGSSRTPRSFNSNLQGHLQTIIHVSTEIGTYDSMCSQNGKDNLNVEPVELEESKSADITKNELTLA